ncbi:lipopolysaccharide biosynthesis protein [Phytohabitans sp. LJ34]|uniref:lipopolysaccharide biosynthesis protein n=1 Tax=Phytohabitans sp. LJ34 TaxID=3452217 RepID=UPI003F8BFB79
MTALGVRSPLYTNVYALSLNTVASLLLGGVYWVVAARLYTPEDVGTGAAVVSTMLLLSSVSQLSLNGALARFLPTAGRDGGRLVAAAYGASCAAAVLLSTVFLVVVRPSSPLAASAFVLSVAAWSVFTLQDSVLTALRGAAWVPVENAAFGLAKVLLLVPFALLVPGLGIFLSWSLPVAVAIVPVTLLVYRRLLPRLDGTQWTGGLPGRGVLIRFVTLDYVAFLFLQAGTNALPVLVTAVLGAEANAVFYVGWLVGGSIGLIADHFGMSLTVESAARPGHLATYTRHLLRKGLLLFAPGALVLCAFAPMLLLPFGDQYVRDSATPLRLFALAVVPRFAVAVYVAACRVRRQVGRIVLAEAAVSTIVVSLAVLTMPSWGVTGVGAAYLVAQLAVAAAVAPALVRLVRSAP